MKNYLVSIITPCFNSATFICETINSVINQSYTNWELILIDDCSTDNTVEIISNYKQEDKRIKFVQLEVNSGAAVARNAGLKIAEGAYISFLDSDDIWMPNKLEIQIDFMIEHNCAISFSDYAIIESESMRELNHVRVPDVISFKGYLKNTIIGMSTSMIDINKTGEFCFVNIRSRQDTLLWITLLKSGHEALGINKILVNYRVRNDSISSNKIKAALKVWSIYRKYCEMNFLKVFYYFSFYLYNAIKKRL